MATKYEKIVQYLTEYIRNNSTKMAKLPTELELCKRFMVSRQTVRKALSVLEESDYITRIQGSGCYIKAKQEVIGPQSMALAITTDNEYLYPALISECRHIFSQAGYSLDVYITEGSFIKEREILYEILRKKYSGVLIEAGKNIYPTPNDDLFDRLLLSGIPCLFLLSGYSNISGIPILSANHINGGRMLASYLQEHRHSKIAGIFCKETSRGQLRALGIFQKLRESIKEYPEEDFFYYKYEELLSLQLVQNTDFLEDIASMLYPNYTAVICENAEIAYWLIRLLETKGHNVPKDISVVCFDDTYLNDISSVSITNVSTPIKEYATSAYHMMKQLMHHQKVISQKLPYTLIEHGSVHTLW